MKSFKVNNSCDACMHTSVCQHKMYFDEAIAKIEEKIDNICMPDIFKVTFTCEEYVAKFNTLPYYAPRIDDSVKLLKGDPWVITTSNEQVRYTNETNL